VVEIFFLTLSFEEGETWGRHEKVGSHVKIGTVEEKVFLFNLNSKQELFLYTLLLQQRNKLVGGSRERNSSD
jgi:hypothetical protein